MVRWARGRLHTAFLCAARAGQGHVFGLGSPEFLTGVGPQQAAEGLKPAVINRLAKELRELQQRPEEGIKARPELAGPASWLSLPYFVSEACARPATQVIVNEDNIADVQADYDGPGPPARPEASAITLPRLCGWTCLGPAARGWHLTVVLGRAQRARPSRAACSA